MVALTDGKDRQTGVDASTFSLPPVFKILMLHGYTQSGPLFRTKTRAIEQMFQKQFSLENMDSNSCFYGYSGVQLIYPTGPVRLSPNNLLGYSSKPLEADEESDLWGWWIWGRDTDPNAFNGAREMDCGTFSGLEHGLSKIARTIRAHGGIDAVMGFSQGAAAALLVTSLLEPGREQAFQEMQKRNKDAVPFPDDWRDLSSLCPNGLKFSVSYSGFQAANTLYRAFYEPRIQTPVLHFIGSLDNVIDEYMTLEAVKTCAAKETTLIYHPGVHYVPNIKTMEDAIMTFISKCLKKTRADSCIANSGLFF